MIKLIASDMDGTLLNEHGQVTLETAQAIRDAQAAGIEFMIATGRAISGAQRFLMEHNLHPAFITLNGARVFDAEGEVIVDHPMTAEMIKTTYDILTANDIYFEIETSNEIYTDNLDRRVVNLAKTFYSLNPEFSYEKTLERARNRVDQMPINLVEDYATFLATSDANVMKFIAFSPDDLEKLDILRAEFAPHQDLIVTASARTNIEINNAAAQKGLALRAYAEAEGYSMDNIMAIGDNLNDRSMIEMSGYGTAMGNAVESIKSIARWTTDTNVNNGVAKAIYRAIELNKSER